MVAINAHHDARGRALRRASLLAAAASITLLLAMSVSAVDPARQASIRRDTYGVPHILADTEEAAAYAHGYATAEDHLPTLAKFFFRARGELSSVFGEENVNDDLQIIELGVWESSRERFGDLSPLMQGILDNYAAGYNQYLSEAGARAPAWAKPITGVDVLAHCRAVYLLNFSPAPELWRRYTPEKPAAPVAASNLWAIGKERSASGHGLLLTNPHLPWKAPYIFHEVHLTVPGRINVAGAALIGFPVVSIGFNDVLGWGHTAGRGQVESIYELTLDPADPARYLYNGRSLPLQSTSTVLRVKTAKGEERRTITIQRSHHGPIIRKNATTAWAFNSPNLTLVDFLTQYNLMAKAKTLDEFKLALSMQQLPVFNVGYADRGGNIFYVHNRRLPVLNTPPKGGIIPGDRDTSDWHVLHPFANLPQLLNPRGGYVQDANNGVAYTNLEQPMDPAAFPAYMNARGDLQLRGQHSLDMIEALKQVTLDDLIRAQFDPLVPLAVRIKSELVSLARGKTVDGVDLTEAANLLDAWDNQLLPDRTGAAVFATWWTNYMRDQQAKAFRTPWDAKRPRETPAGIGNPEAAVAVLAKVVKEKTAQFGRLAVPWGEMYRLKRGKVDVPAPGASSALGFFNTLEFTGEASGKHTSIGGTTYSLAVEFTPVPTAFSVLPYSESSDPSSPHFDDQTAIYGKRTLKRLWMSDADIEANTTRRYTPGSRASTAAASPASAGAR